MGRDAALVSKARALMQGGANVIDAFRHALRRVPAAAASRKLAASILGVGKPENVARHLRALADEAETPKAPAADVRAGALLDVAARLRRRAEELRAAAPDEFAMGLADELDAEADQFEDCARTGKAVR